MWWNSLWSMWQTVSFTWTIGETPAYSALLSEYLGRTTFVYYGNRAVQDRAPTDSMIPWQPYTTPLLTPRQASALTSSPQMDVYHRLDGSGLTGDRRGLWTVEKYTSALGRIELPSIRPWNLSCRRGWCHWGDSTASRHYATGLLPGPDFWSYHVYRWQLAQQYRCFGLRAGTASTTETAPLLLRGSPLLRCEKRTGHPQPGGYYAYSLPSRSTLCSALLIATSFDPQFNPFGSRRHEMVLSIFSSWVHHVKHGRSVDYGKSSLEAARDLSEHAMSNGSYGLSQSFVLKNFYKFKLATVCYNSACSLQRRRPLQDGLPF